jgi:thiamine-phosphate pyrophosphorylase
VKIIVVSPQSAHKNESEIIESLFEAGLDLLHIRKPGYSRSRLEKYIKKIPEKYWNKLVIHSYHRLALKYKLNGIYLTRKQRKRESLTTFLIEYLKFFKPDLTISASFHNLANLYDPTDEFDYVFLSPVFDSISKSGYQSGFNFHSLRAAMLKTTQNVIAIGGIELNTLEKIKNINFKGIALVGAIWQSANPVKEFIAIKEKCKSLEIV